MNTNHNKGEHIRRFLISHLRQDACSSATFPPRPIAPADVEGNSEEATVVDLFPWTEYEFRVIATNTLGIGDPSPHSPKVTTKDAGKNTEHGSLLAVQP